jgi:hypothetical protein
LIRLSSSNSIIIGQQELAVRVWFLQPEVSEVWRRKSDFSIFHMITRLTLTQNFKSRKI